jgi:hypothetical protein
MLHFRSKEIGWHWQQNSAACLALTQRKMRNFEILAAQRCHALKRNCISKKIEKLALRMGFSGGENKT